MRNITFIVLCVFGFQNVVSYPLRKKSVLELRFDIPPLLETGMADTSSVRHSLLPSLTESTQNASPPVDSLSAGGKSSLRKSVSISSTSTTEDNFSYSIIGTLPPLPVPSDISPMTVTGGLSSPSPTAQSYPIPTDTPASSSRSISTHIEKEWKVIGIGLLVLGSIGSMILLVVFFEAWYGFLLDLCGMKKERGSEEMIPDSTEKTWQLKLSDEDWYRYPSASSMEPINDTKTFSKSPYPYPVTPKPLFQPPSYFRSGYDPHPLEPLCRRPSCRTPVTKSPSMLPYS